MLNPHCLQSANSAFSCWILGLFTTEKCSLISSQKSFAFSTYIILECKFVSIMFNIQHMIMDWTGENPPSQVHPFQFFAGSIYETLLRAHKDLFHHSEFSPFLLPPSHRCKTPSQHCLDIEAKDALKPC